MPRCERLEICPMFNDIMAGGADARTQRYCRGDYQKCARHIALQMLGPADVPRDLYPDDHRRLHRLTLEA